MPVLNITPTLACASGERIADRDVLAGTITLTLRDLSGKVLRESKRTSGTWSWQRDTVYRDGLLLATVDGAGTKHFHLDHLGTVRRITGTGSPAAVLASHDYYPFGMEASGTCQDTERMKFTGHERDLMGTCSSQTDDLDYMHARYYSPYVGRFLGVDPVRGNPNQPQSWNLYSYVQNNVINSTDPDGRAPTKVIGWIVKLLKKGLVREGEKLGRRELATAVKEGEDVILASRKEAKAVARAAGDGKAPVLDKAHGPKEEGFRDHYHTANRQGGHVFFSIAAGLTLSHYAEGRGGFLETAAGLADLANPLSLFQDAIDIGNLVSDLGEAIIVGNDPISPADAN